MKKLLTTITAAALLLSLSACSSKNAAPQGGSSSSLTSSTTTYTMKAGDDLATLQKDGVIPDLAVLGVDTADFTFWEISKRVISGKWVGDGESPVINNFTYSSADERVLIFDEYGRLSGFVGDPKGVEDRQKKLSEEELLSICTDILKNCLSDVSPDLFSLKSKEYIPESEYMAGAYKFAFRHEISDDVYDLAEFSIYENGTIGYLKIWYCDIDESFSSKELRQKAESYFEKTIPEKYSKDGVVSTDKKEGYCFKCDGKIYGNFTAKITVSDSKTNETIYNDALAIIID